MKTREAFEAIRNQKNRMGLRLRLTLMVTAELVLCVLIAMGLAVLLDSFVQFDSWLLLVIALLGVCLVVGILITSFLSKWFFGPIKKLGTAMEAVADGDFSVRLETKSSAKEIREVFSGFNLMVHELAATEILQSDFTSNVSHEFKTPINAIEGYAMLLQGCENLEGEQRQYVEKILYNTQRLSSLVGNILLLSKIENQSIQTKRTRFSLDEQIRQCIVALESAWSEKDVELDVDMDSVEYLGSENLMYHVWDNLIGNAIKFSPPCGLVRIRLRRAGEQVVFTIDDNGPGIPEEDRKHIFDKFYQADSSHRQEGNGLGLALVKRILAITDSEISVRNLSGGGCRFTVTLNP